MARILINDVMDELKDQNTRLFSDLKKCQKLNELLLKYRICLINYLNVCKCDESVDKSSVQTLEEEYKRLTDPNITEVKKEIFETEDNSQINVNKLNANENMDTRDISIEEKNRIAEPKKRGRGRPKNPNLKTIICDWVGCGQTCYNRDDLTLHKRTVHMNKTFKCNKCYKSYGLKKNLRTYEKTHSVVKCNVKGCKQTFISTIGLSIHKRADHSDQHFAHCCDWPGCQMTFRRNDTLQKHILCHKNEKRYKCDVDGCGKTFNTNDNLIVHSKSHQVNRPRVPCTWPGCDKHYRTYNYMTGHMKVKHLNIKNFKCDVCGKQFPKAYQLKFHMRVHEVKTKTILKCDQCMREFPRQTLLDIHKKSHSSEPQFLCEWPECGQKFWTLSSLGSHKRNHTNGGKFMCSIPECGKGFSTRYRQMRHEMSHNKPLECSWPGCGHRVSTKYLLEVHMKAHQNIKDFKCPIEGCGHTFFKRSVLWKHMDRHSNPQPFKCEFTGCDKKFADKQTVVRHMQRVHQVYD